MERHFRREFIPGDDQPWLIPELMDGLRETALKFNSTAYQGSKDRSEAGLKKEYTNLMAIEKARREALGLPGSFPKGKS